MKNKQQSVLISFCLAGMLWGGVGAANAAVEATVKADEKVETIYVEYRENITESIYRPYNAMFGENDRFYYFKRNFEKAFEKEKWGVKFKFERFPLKAPEGAKVLEMTFLNLRSWGPLEVELSMWAKLDEGSKEHDFGVQLVKHVPEAFATSSSIERDLDALYKKVAEKVIKDLNNTLFVEE